MTPTRTILLNLISGLSLSICIIFGVTYMSFKNANVFQDIKIEIINNPITGSSDIEFSMIGYKRYECNSTRIYGVAYAEDGSHSHKLDAFTRQYTRNVRPGEIVPNTWSMERPADMSVGGRYRVTMYGDFVCNHWVFKVPKTAEYSNILLIVKSVDNNTE